MTIIKKISAIVLALVMAVMCVQISFAEEGIFDTLANLVRDKLLDIAEAAKRVNMSTEEFIVAAGLK